MRQISKHLGVRLLNTCSHIPNTRDLTLLLSFSNTVVTVQAYYCIMTLNLFPFYLYMIQHSPKTINSILTKVGLKSSLEDIKNQFRYMCTYRRPTQSEIQTHYPCFIVFEQDQENSLTSGTVSDICYTFNIPNMPNGKISIPDI